MEFIDLISFKQFWRFNKYIGMELFYLSVMLIMIIVVFMITFFKKGKYKYNRKEKFFFSIYKSLSFIFTLCIFIIHLSDFYWNLQGNPFGAREMVVVIYQNILGFGTFVYELIFLLFLYIFFRIIFFLKFRKENLMHPDQT